LINDIEVAVFGKRCGFKVRIRPRTAERYGIGELEVFGVGLVDSVERRVTLRVVGPVIHQPVLWLLVGVDQSFRSHLSGNGGTGCGEHCAREQDTCQRVVLWHRVPPCTAN
jgi:hypothetical protein